MCYTLWVVVTVISVIQVSATPQSATDNFKSPCRFVSTTARTTLWSHKGTWPGGIIPGVGQGFGANATIPCGTFVTLDLSNITLGTLRIQGKLQFWDNPKLPNISIKANFIIVEGQLFIGSKSKPFSQKASIELTPNLKFNRKNFSYTGPAPPADPLHPRNLGHKSFAVIGGQVILNGLPSNDNNMPTWVRLSRDANAGQRNLTLDTDVSLTWPAGSQIVVTSTSRSFSKSEAEKLTIVNVTRIPNGYSTVFLDRALVYNHSGSFNSFPDGFGGFVDQRAEVMLLSRNILVFGTDEPAPHDLEGGHFITFMTNSPAQFIQGVELVGMGQQGLLGRYPLHFHVIGNAPNTVCRKNSIHGSKQRCIVVHASHNITVENNVAFNNSGHCFILEEGGETNNTFIDNLGAYTKKALIAISPLDTDNSRTSVFWITAPKNNFIGNVAAGSIDSGYWYEMRGSVRGLSLSIPGLNNTVPYNGVIGTFLNNVAHSNRVGLRNYPSSGMRPRVSTGDRPYNVFDSFKVYQNYENGLFIHRTDSLAIVNSVFADNGWSIYFDHNNRINLTNSRFVYATANNSPQQLCKAGPSFGIAVDQGNPTDVLPYNFKNLTFYNFSKVCSTVAALVTLGDPGEFFNPGYNIQNLSFKQSLAPLWFPPENATIFAYKNDNGEQSKFYAIYDKDGSLNNGKTGYIVANTNAILPPKSKGCSFHPTWNAYTCAGACYRALMVTFVDPSFGTTRSSSPSDYSLLKITRLSDGKQLVLEGNLGFNGTTSDRTFIANLLANQTYLLEVVPPSGNAAFLTESVSVSVSLNDVGECGAGLTVQLQNLPSSVWNISNSDSVFYSPCPGAAAPAPARPIAQYTTVCTSGVSAVQLYFHPEYSLRPITLSRSFHASGSCSSPSALCSLAWSATAWLYNDSGIDRTATFADPILVDPQNWSSGVAPLGANFGSRESTELSPQNPRNHTTYYYRKTFPLQYSSCYTALSVQVLATDGFAISLNGNPVLRYNLPAGNITARTYALANSTAEWTTLTVPLAKSSGYFLVDGTNTVAVEQHFYFRGNRFLFDARIAAVLKSPSCKLKQTAKPEVCNGLDDNLDGLVDNGPHNKPLSISCVLNGTVGTSVCVNGYYQACA